MIFSEYLVVFSFLWILFIFRERGKEEERERNIKVGTHEGQGPSLSHLCVLHSQHRAGPSLGTVTEHQTLLNNDWLSAAGGCGVSTKRNRKMQAAPGSATLGLCDLG